MNLLRVQVTSLVTLSQTFRVDGDPTDVTGSATATVRRMDGTQIAGSPFTCTHGSTGVYTFPLPATSQVDYYIVSWSGVLAGATVVLTDYVDVVGGFYFGLDEAAEAVKGAVQRDPAKYTDAYLAGKRTGVEQECDILSGQAWVPRFKRYLLNGTGSDELMVPDIRLRAVRAASVALSAAGPFTALSVDELAALACDPAGIITRTDGASWPLGRSNVIVEYECGDDLPTVGIHDAALLRLKSFVNTPNAQVPDRALYQTSDNGNVFRLMVAGPKSTGIPDVDAAYRRKNVDAFWLAR